jgi:hypothetical protein
MPANHQSFKRLKESENEGEKKTSQLRSFLEGDIDSGSKEHRDTPVTESK